MHIYRHVLVVIRPNTNRIRSSLFWDVTQRIFVVIDVSGQLIGTIFKSQIVQEVFLDSLTLEDGTDRLPPKRR
jgi:hypothetical protein